jgi:Ubiquitin carboxyl-terminal hydrolase
MRSAAAGGVTGANRSGAQGRSAPALQAPFGGGSRANGSSTQRAVQQQQAAAAQQQARGTSSSAAVAAARGSRAPIVNGSLPAGSSSSSSSAGGASHYIGAPLSRNTSIEQYGERQTSSDSSSRWLSYKHSPARVGQGSSAHVQNYLSGMKNLGNTCYLNAVLQALLSLSGFVDDLQVSL